MHETNRTRLGICAIDYRVDEQDPNPDTTGLIVDDVSYLERPPIRLPINSSYPLGYARTYGATSAVAMPLDRDV